MEFCPGGSLNTRLDAQNRLSADRVRWVSMQIADALAAAHSAGILHRGVTRAKILIDSYGNARLTDFGLAAVVGAGIEGTDPPPAPSAYTPRRRLTRPRQPSSATSSPSAPRWWPCSRPSTPASGGDPVGKDRGSERRAGPLSAVAPSLVTALMSGLAIEPGSDRLRLGFRDQLLEVSLVAANRRIARPTTSPPGWRRHPERSRRRPRPAPEAGLSRLERLPEAPRARSPP